MTVPLPSHTPEYSAQLASAGMALIGCQTPDEVFDVIRDFLAEATPGHFGVVSRTTVDSRHVVVHAVTGLNASTLARAASLAGFELVGKGSVIDDRFLDRVFKRSLQKVEGGFAEFAANDLPASVGSSIAKVLGIHDVHIIGITDGATVYGNMSVLTLAPDAELPAGAIESLAHMAFLTLARIEAACELADTAQRFHLLFDQSPDGIVILDPVTARPIDFNETAHRQLGYTREEFAALDLSRIEAAETPEETRSRIERVVTDGRSDFETRQRTKTGEIRNVHVTAQTITLGEHVVFHCVWRDITERTHAQEELRERKEFIETVLDHAPIGFAVNRIDNGESVMVGRTFEAIYGVAQGSLGGVDDFFESVYIDPVQREQMRERVMADIASGDASRMRWANIAITTRSGDNRVLTSMNRPLPDQNLMISTVQDVTDQWRAEEALRESEARFRALLESANEGIMLLSDQGVVVSANPAMARMYGYEVDEMTSMTLADLETAEGSSLAPDRLRRIFAGETLSFEVENRRRGGTVMSIEVTTSAVAIGGEKYALAFHRDISERRAADARFEEYRQQLEALVGERTSRLAEANERLRQTNAELLVATAAKNDFLAAMSHELRTPMNSIIGFSGILGQGLAGPMNPEQSAQLEMINRSGRHLLSLIDGVLDLAKIEAGRDACVFETVDPNALVREVIDAVRPLAADRGLLIDVDDAADEGSISTDPGKLRQILFNLVGNAVKFTESGSVCSKVRRDDGGDWEFSVADTGQGIAAKDLSRIFEPFTQLESPVVAKSKGTGLGLRISREYAHLLGGEITVTSAEGEGSTFTLRLPVEPPVCE